MKQFDKKFSRKAKEAFDNYNADHLAGEGWNSFTGKYGRKRRRAIVIPLWAKAASIAVLVTLGVLFTARINDRKAGEPVRQTAQENRPGSTESATNKEDSAATAPVIVSPALASQVTVINATQSRQTGREKSDYAGGSLLAETVVADKSSVAETVKAGGSLLDDTVIAVEASAWTNLPDNPMELRVTEDAEARLKLKPKKALKDLIDLPREKMTTTIMTGLSGMMASIDNTASNAQGVSLGFYVEQQLTRRISVRPGLAMAKHSYTMEGIAGGDMAFNYAAPELNGMSGTTTSYKADIEVLSMEVPVNFVFSLRKRSGSNLFVTTGASTVIYLNQHLSGNFNNTYTRAMVDNSTGDVLYGSMNTSVTIDSRQESFNRVDFLGLANFSAGYSFPFAKTSHFVFEPFIQLPVKDLTSLNLRIRYGGLSMKLQF
ncbi:MAG: outer membrane beta-barrel protein [Bacteroidales bacterium]|nr:outer membrane beta-barrel protein [Bacteroidales bacterium]